MGSIISSNAGTATPQIRMGSSTQDKHHLNQLTLPDDIHLLCPIRYVYDYLPEAPSWLAVQRINLGDILATESYLIQGDTRQNGFSLYPENTKLPVHTGLSTFRQSKHWQANGKATRELLQLFAQDQHCGTLMLSNGQSMAKLAERQLKSEVLDTYSRFSIYMFPDGDEKRIQLLAQSVILIFIFDDMWENASSEMAKQVRDDFIGRIQGNVSSTVADTPLQKRMHEIRQGFLDGDREEGNGGVEVLEKLIDFCRHKHPTAFLSMREYLDYRFDDIANEFTWACTKFSLRSSVDLNDAKYSRLLGLIGDQISIANDIASYDKEARQFSDGTANEMINFVHTVMQIDRIKDATSAKSMAYAKQLWTENEILVELETLKEGNEMSFEEWRFVDGCLVAASGNLLTSVFIARYGGESARIEL